MGGFIVFPKRTNELPNEIEDKFRSSLDVFTKKNLTLDRRLIRNNLIAYRYHKTNTHSDNVIEFDNGDFAFSTGTFIYGNKIGKNALIDFYNDFSFSEFNESKISGNFSLLLYKDEKLWSLCDYCGYYPIYTHDSTHVISSSFLATARTSSNTKINKQVFFEYIFHGFFINEETLLQDIHVLDSRMLWRLDSSPKGKERTPSYDPIPQKCSISEIVENVSGKLNDYYDNLVTIFPKNIGSALSGGYDSRHMLALMTHAGAIPYLYVYGNAHSPDVVVAHEIAKGENLLIDHIDKGLHKKISINEFNEAVQRNTYFFDCIKPMGVIDDGSDLDARFSRGRHAKLLLNGAGGEIYREIWNIPNGSVDLIEFLKMRFDYGYYDYCHQNEFNLDRYFSNFSEKIRAILKIDSSSITRRQAEILFPFLRNKFAQSNNAANSQISHSLLPFMESKFVYPSFDIPINYKYCGRIHAELIRTAAPSLAKYNSAYGINFSDSIPISYQLQGFIGRHLPLSLRLMKRVRASRKPQAMPYYFDKPYLESILPVSSLKISKYVDISKAPNPETLSRILSVELLLNNI